MKWILAFALAITSCQKSEPKVVKKEVKEPKDDNGNVVTELEKSEDQAKQGMSKDQQVPTDTARLKQLGAGQVRITTLSGQVHTFNWTGEQDVRMEGAPSLYTSP